MFSSALERTEYLIKLCNFMSYTSVLSFFLNVCRPRPWLVDDLDEWRSRLTGGDEVKKVPHKCAAIFIDNSGVDVVLGVIPFVQFLLGRGTEVILCANNRPVLNDVTYAELVTLVQVRGHTLRMTAIFRPFLTPSPPLNAK